jgi:hypothetical protein
LRDAEDRRQLDTRLEILFARLGKLDITQRGTPEKTSRENSNWNDTSLSMNASCHQIPVLLLGSSNFEIHVHPPPAVFDFSTFC